MSLQVPKSLQFPLKQHLGSVLPQWGRDSMLADEKFEFGFQVASSQPVESCSVRKGRREAVSSEESHVAPASSSIEQNRELPSQQVDLLEYMGKIRELASEFREKIRHLDEDEMALYDELYAEL
jgi:hypothetical protein